MTKIIAEETGFYYFPRNHDIPVNEFVGMEPRKLGDAIGSFMLGELAQAKDFRLILVQEKMLHLENKPDYFRMHYLYWCAEIDLDVLDRRVKDGTFTDKDFESAIKTYHEITFCNECDKRWQTLVFATSDVYVDAPELYAKKVIIAYNHILKCPNCGTPFRIPVVRVFEEVIKDHL